MPSPTPHTASNALNNGEPNRGVRITAFFLIAAACCGLDLWSKHAVFEWRGMPGRNGIYWIVDGYFGIETALNNGALFGMGQGYTWFFAGLSILALIGIAYWYCWAAWRDRVLTLALGSILGGIGGNLYDRLGLWPIPGFPDQSVTRVRDWILMCWGPDLVWPNYNIADCCLVFGAGLLMFHLLVLEPRAEANVKLAAKSDAVDAG